jgi:flagellar basal body-associated protein FliL
MPGRLGQLNSFSSGCARRYPISFVMNFLFKIEDLLNNVLLWLGHKLMLVWNKICPSWMKTKWLALKLKLTEWKNFRPRLKPRDLLKIKVDYMGVFAAALDAGQKAFQKSKQHSPLKAVVSAFSAPFVYLFQWAANLKPAHFIILFVFTTASIFSVMGIVIQSKKMLQTETASRAPAAAEVAYSRPAYHKIDERELTFNNVKIPVYVTGLNELRALIIDFSVVTSNRATKRWLEKNEFQMRDHLIQTLEPVLPSFPMTEEGRAMITEKLKAELNVFLANHQVEGEIKETRLVYILAH